MITLGFAYVLGLVSPLLLLFGYALLSPTDGAALWVEY